MAVEPLVVLNAGFVSVFVGFGLPIVVGLLTKYRAPAGLKAALLAVLSAAQGFIVTATVADGTAVISKTAALAATAGWVTAVATHFGFWKPLKVPEHLASEFGLSVDPGPPGGGGGGI